MKVHRSILIFFLIIISSGFFYWIKPESKLADDIIANKLVVYKSKRKMELWSGGAIVKVYTISLGGNPTGHKQKKGDEKTPEGKYFINDKNPNSGYYLNLGISYPNAQDKLNSENPGGDIKIHGLKNGQGWIGKFQRFIDWTNGCIAVTNEEMDELYRSVAIGTPIYINL